MPGQAAVSRPDPIFHLEGNGRSLRPSPRRSRTGRGERRMRGGGWCSCGGQATCACSPDSKPQTHSRTPRRVQCHLLCHPLISLPLIKKKIILTFCSCQVTQLRKSFPPHAVPSLRAGVTDTRGLRALGAGRRPTQKGRRPETPAERPAGQAAGGLRPAIPAQKQALPVPAPSSSLAAGQSPWSPASSSADQHARFKEAAAKNKKGTSF